MSVVQHVLFIQGGGAGVHDDWDSRMVASLIVELGEGYEVRYPYMPQEDDPTFARWGPAIENELTAMKDGAVVVGHSVGATILINSLAHAAPPRRLGAIVLIAAPFVGVGGWPSDEFTLTHDVGTRLPHGVPVHLFHGLNDETAPPGHVELYRRAIAHAQVHVLPGRDHQLNDDLSEVAQAVADVAGTRVICPGRRSGP